MAQVEVEGAQKDHKLKAGNPVSVCTLQYLIHLALLWNTFRTAL